MQILQSAITYCLEEVMSKHTFGSIALKGLFAAALFAGLGSTSCATATDPSLTIPLAALPNCTTEDMKSAIRLSIVPSRFNGVAPLSVFFDASGTTATATTRPFHDLEYRWDFGDPAGSPISGTKWLTGSRASDSSRNKANGPEAAHVYETPGVYTVTLTATDGTNTVSNSCVQIVVQDPDVVFAGANTTCVGAMSLPVQGVAGCPANANVALQSNFVSAISKYASTGKRVLFKRGDTFTGTSSARIDKNGPGIVGAYGSGAAPSLQMTGDAPLLTFSSSSTPTIKDWRIMDLDLDGLAGNQTIGIYAGGGFNQLLVLRLNIHNMVTGISGGLSILDHWNWSRHPGHKIFEEWSIVDTVINSDAGCATSPKKCDWRIYLAGKRINIQGSILDNMVTGGSHVIRSEYMNKGVISNNTIARAGASQHAIKLHAQEWSTSGVTNPGAAGAYTEQVVISDNKIIGANNDWTVSIGPQNAQRDERVRNIIVERNWFIAGPGTQLAIESSASDSTYRNNICDMTGARAHTCFYTGQRGIEPPSNNVRFYNNIFYSGSTGDFTGVSIGKTATNVTVINNLGYAPSATSPVMISGTGASGLVSSTNSTNTQIKSIVPGWVSDQPLAPVDYTLTNRSYAFGAGGAVPVFSDFFLKAKTKNNLGATSK